MEFDYEKKIADLEKQVEFERRQTTYHKRTIDVLVAVGYLSPQKLEQAREIVSGLSD
jgi:hypothetical protein